MNNAENSFLKKEINKSNENTKKITNLFLRILGIKYINYDKTLNDFKDILNNSNSIEKIKSKKEWNDKLYEIYYLIKNNYIDIQ